MRIKVFIYHILLIIFALLNSCKTNIYYKKKVEINTVRSVIFDSLSQKLIVNNIIDSTYHNYIYFYDFENDNLISKYCIDCSTFCTDCLDSLILNFSIFNQRSDKFLVDDNFIYEIFVETHNFDPIINEGITDHLIYVQDNIYIEIIRTNIISRKREYLKIETDINELDLLDQESWDLDILINKNKAVILLKNEVFKFDLSDFKRFTVRYGQDEINIKDKQKFIE